jgi:flagellar biogenesis protein FliO
MYTSKSFSFNKRAWLPRRAGAESSAASGLTGARALLTRLIGAFAGRPVAGGALEHLATLPLGGQPSLVLVRLGQQTLLLGATARQINLLAKIPSDASELSAFVDDSSAREESARQ